MTTTTMPGAFVFELHLHAFPRLSFFTYSSVNLLQQFSNCAFYWHFIVN